VSALFLQKIAHHLEDFFKTGPLKGFTSKEPRTKEVFEFNHEMLRGFVDAGPTGFPNDVMASRGLWPSPQTGARKRCSIHYPESE
jgi:hypothetical protein